MIQKISNNSFNVSFAKDKNTGKGTKTAPTLFKSEGMKAYADSFVRQSKESAPMLLGFTALWSAIDYATRGIPATQSVIRNLTGFFLPVLVTSSAFLAAIETKKTSKSSN